MEDLLPSFESIENLSLIIDYFWSTIQEFLDLGLLDDVNDFNDFVVAILNNIEEILMIYPNFEGSLSNLSMELSLKKFTLKTRVKDYAVLFYNIAKAFNDLLANPELDKWINLFYSGKQCKKQIENAGICKGKIIHHFLLLNVT